MFYYLLILILIPFKIWAASGAGDEELKSLTGAKGARGNYQTLGTDEESPAAAAQEDWSPSRHRVIARSCIVKHYIECSTICCFLSRGWLHTMAFMTGVATCTLAGIAYGVSDPAMKDTLNLTLVVATAATAAFQKFEAYARESVDSQEREYGMFEASSPPKDGAHEAVVDHAAV